MGRDRQKVKVTLVSETLFKLCEKQADRRRERKIEWRKGRKKRAWIKGGGERKDGQREGRRAWSGEREGGRVGSDREREVGKENVLYNEAKEIKIELQ